MNLLSALLPGARQVRAPLAAGATWLLAIWLAVEPGLADASEATGIYASLVRLDELAGGAWVIGVVAFLAYMLGSVSTSVAVLVDSHGAGRRAFLGNPVRALVLDRVWSASHRLRERTGFTLEQAADHREAKDLFAPPAERPFVEAGDSDMEIVKNLEFRIRRYGSWREAKLQLLGKEPELFAEVDRLDAERELRVALLAPLLTLTIVVAVRVAPWYASLAVAGVGLVLIWILWAQSAMARSMSERAILDVVRVGSVTVPLLARLDHDVDVLAERLGANKH
jgi:hypothetical protein